MRIGLIIILTLALYGCKTPKSFLGLDVGGADKIVVKDHSQAIVIYIRNGVNDTIYVQTDSLKVIID